MSRTGRVHPQSCDPNLEGTIESFWSVFTFAEGYIVVVP